MPAMRFERMGGDLHDLFRCTDLGHVTQDVSIGMTLIHRLGGASDQRADCLDPGCHIGEADRDCLVGDKQAAALQMALDKGGGAFKTGDADAGVLGGLNDLARAETGAGIAQRLVSHQHVTGRDLAILKRELAVVHEATTHRHVAFRDMKAGSAARDEKARRAVEHAFAAVGIGIDDLEGGIVAVGDLLFCAH